jgi:geranylgeranyl diphosphate synthase type II
MKTIAELQELIQQTVSAKKYPATPALLYEPISYIMSLGGKRLRPTLLLMACDAFQGDLTEAINPAMAIEVFHNFTLMHDDIMDNAPLRRGKATVHEKWNANVAILSGDVMLVEAYKLISTANQAILPTLIQIFNDTAAGVCEGQQMDMDLEDKSSGSIEEYLNMIRLKTAVLLGGALKMGAVIGGANEKNTELLYNFGVQLGVAFQLQDDLLDVYGNPEKFGKQTGGDIISNKKTYLLITAANLAQGNDQAQLQHWLDAADFENVEKVNAVKEIYDKLEIRNHTLQAVKKHADEAFKNLEEINLPEQNKAQLLAFAEQLLNRDF